MIKDGLVDIDDISVLKEAEEIEKEAIKWVRTNSGYSTKEFHGQKAIEAYKDGAKFGYNKANEWHYVKDRDLPKRNKMCLLYLGGSFNPTTGWIENGIWYFEDSRKNSIWQTKVIAWKEIVLPELKGA